MAACGECKWFLKDINPGLLGGGWCYCPMPACVPVDAEVPSYTVCERSELDCPLFSKASQAHISINQNRQDHQDMDPVEYFKTVRTGA